MSTSTEIVKMKQGMMYSCKEKTIILNVFKYLRKVYPDKSLTEIVRRTSEATGCSEKSIFQFRKEEASPEGFREPVKTKVRKNININSRFIKYDETVRESIKNIIYALKSNNIVPSLSVILRNVNSDDKLPNFSPMTLRRLLFDMGFFYEKEKTGNKMILVEKGSNKDENCKVDQISSTTLSQSCIKPYSEQITQRVSDVQPHNQMYVPDYPHRLERQVPVPLPNHEVHMVDKIGYQHNILLNRVPNSVHTLHQHNMGFFNHSHQTLNPVMY